MSGNGNGNGNGNATTGGNGGKGNGNGNGNGNVAIGPETQHLVNTIANQLQGVGGAGATTEDLLKLGMGLGMSIAGNGAMGNLGNLGNLSDMGGVPSSRSRSPSRSTLGGASTPTGTATGAATSSEWDVTAPSHSSSFPIGVSSPTKMSGEQTVLDHGSEEAQRASLLRDTAGIKTSDAFKGLVVVEPTPAPDEIVAQERNILMDSEEMMKLTVPVLAHGAPRVGPLTQDFETHPAAGKGTQYVAEADGEKQRIVEGESGSGVVVRRSSEPIPAGFLNSISATHVGKQHVDYLPNVPNLPQCKPVGRVKPRSAAEDWLAIGFDPWSAGKEPLSAEFIPSLTVKDDSLLDAKEAGGADGAFINLMDKKGLEAQQEIAAQENKMAQDFAELCSYVRHGKYKEVEEKMNEPDWTLPIDYPDAVGNTLLMVACQNGNKRIAKLCLRRGSELNKQNINGQGALHYSFGYGFDDLGEYLVAKGADNSLRNADGLTCYEGLNMGDVSGI